MISWNDKTVLDIMKRYLTVILPLLCIAAVNAFAQRTVTMTHDYSGYRKIDVSNRFDVSVVRGDTCRVKISVDELIASYVTSYIKNNTLYLDVDEKAFTPELKKTFKGKNAIVPVLEAEVSVKYLDTLFLHGNAVLDNELPLFSDDSVAVVMDGASMISNLEFKGRKLFVSMTKTASANLTADADAIYASTYGASALNLKYSADSLMLNVGGTASAKTDGTSELCRVYSESSSEVVMKGSSDMLLLKGTGKSFVNADALETAAASLAITGPSKCIVDATDKLKVDLSAGAHLIFNGTPAVEIKRIVSSSMTRPGNTEK